MPSLLYITVIQVPHKDEHTMGCEYDSPLLQRISIFQQILFFLLAFVVMAFCYIKILGRIARTRSHTKNRAVKLVFCIVAVFFLGWVPYNIVIFLRMLADHLVALFDCEISIQLDYAFQVCRLIAFSHCCLNPVFYAFVGVKFRSHLKSMLHRMFSRQSPVDQQPVRTQALVSQGSMY